MNRVTSLAMRACAAGSSGSASSQSARSTPSRRSSTVWTSAPAQVARIAGSMTLGTAMSTTQQRRPRRLGLAGGSAADVFGHRLRTGCDAPVAVMTTIRRGPVLRRGARGELHGRRRLWPVPARATDRDPQNRMRFACRLDESPGGELARLPPVPMSSAVRLAQRAEPPACKLYAGTRHAQCSTPDGCVCAHPAARRDRRLEQPPQLSAGGAGLQCALERCAYLPLNLRLAEHQRAHPRRGRCEVTRDHLATVHV